MSALSNKPIIAAASLQNLNIQKPMVKGISLSEVQGSCKNLTQTNLVQA